MSLLAQLSLHVTPGVPQSVIFSTLTNDPALVLLLDDDFCFEVCMRKLPLSEQAKVRRSKIGQKKRLVAALFTSVVLNYCIYVQGGVAEFDPWARIEFQYNQFGKPCIKHQDTMRFVFNSSSSNDLMVVAVQLHRDSAVGVDLSHESQHSISPHGFMDQFEGIFDPREKRQLQAIATTAERYVAFNQFWTLKEAFTKYVGCGLNVDLASFWFLLPSSPLVLRDSIGPGSGYVARYDIHWQTGITVDCLKLPQKMRHSMSGKPLVCTSGVLRTGSDIPVIISVVEDEPGLQWSGLHLDFCAILLDVV